MPQIVDITNIRSIATTDKRVRGGVPVFKGTRVPVYFVLEDLSLGWAEDDILKTLPEVKRKYVRFLLASLANTFKHNGKKKIYHTR